MSSVFAAAARGMQPSAPESASEAGSVLGSPLRAQGKGDLKQSTEKAKVALRFWLKKGKTEVDPDNQKHISAYLALKDLLPAGRHVTLKAFLNAIGGATVGNAKGARFTTSFWMVPKVNFPNGLPKSIVDHEVSAEELARLFDVPGDFDCSSRYIVDQVVPRLKLGQRVSEFTFYQRHQEEIKVSKDTITGSRRRPRMELDLEDIEKVSSGSSGEESDEAPLSLATVKKDPRTWRSPSFLGQPSAPKNPPPRRLRHALSDDHHADQAVLADRVLDHIEGAAASGALYHPNDESSHTVHFWASQMVFALAKSLETSQGDGARDAFGAQASAERTPLQAGLTKHYITGELHLCRAVSLMVAVVATVPEVLEVALVVRTTNTATGTSDTIATTATSIDITECRRSVSVICMVGLGQQAQLVSTIVAALVESDSVLVLRHFMPIIRRLEALGCFVPEITAAVGALAKAVGDTPELANVVFKIKKVDLGDAARAKGDEADRVTAEGDQTGGKVEPDALGDLGGPARLRFFCAPCTRVSWSAEARPRGSRWWRPTPWSSAQTL